MKKTLLTALLTAAAISTAYAQETLFGSSEEHNGVYIYDIPSPPSPRPICYILNDKLACDKPILQTNPPRNCRWTLITKGVPKPKNVYVCRDP